MEQLKERLAYIYRYEVFSAKLIELELKALYKQVRILKKQADEYKQELEQLRPYHGQIRRLKNEIKQYKKDLCELRP